MNSNAALQKYWDESRGSFFKSDRFKTGRLSWATDSKSYFVQEFTLRHPQQMTYPALV